LEKDFLPTPSKGLRENPLLFPFIKGEKIPFLPKEGKGLEKNPPSVSSPSLWEGED